MRLSRDLGILLLALMTGGVAMAQTVVLPPSSPESVSLAFLGAYRKSMEIEAEVHAAADRYGVERLLARALCMYESGANANLTSGAGARGYFQVMPETFRRMGVKTNIEAGLKYVAQQLERFEREDLALGAYNGGPGRINRGRQLPLETLQYVVGVGYFKNVLLGQEARIRRKASELKLYTVQEGDTWWSVSRRIDRSLLLLRMYNPFLALRPLSSGQLVAYPSGEESPPVAIRPGELSYTARTGDLYLLLAAAFGVGPDPIREVNGLWHVDLLLPGTPLVIPLEREEANWVEHAVVPDADLGDLAIDYGVPVWDVIRDNALWGQSLQGVEVVRIDLERRRPRYATYKVRRGDTLTAIARRHDLPLEVLRKANGFSSNHWRIRVGEVLRIPIT
jgi:LysM repeat protein